MSSAVAVPDLPLDPVARADAVAGRLRDAVLRLRTELGRVIVGQRALVDGLISALLAGGHVLLEGVPGLGKTLVIKALGRSLELRVSRIQFTPDLLPADILGTQTLLETPDGPTVAFKPGPIFAELVLADEINRANPRTQAAMLEAMAERQVTHGTETRSLGPPFFVMATENPIDMEGTYPLPEAQADRFLLKLLVPLPKPEELRDILDVDPSEALAALKPIVDRAMLLEFQQHVKRLPASDAIKDLVVDLICRTRPESVPARFRPYVQLGASPRGAQGLLAIARARAAMVGRVHVSAEDVRAAAPAVLRHRILLNFVARADGVRTDDVIDAILSSG